MVETEGAAGAEVTVAVEGEAVARAAAAMAVAAREVGGKVEGGRAVVVRAAAARAAVVTVAGDGGAALGTLGQSLGARAAGEKVVARLEQDGAFGLHADDAVNLVFEVLGLGFGRACLGAGGLGRCFRSRGLCLGGLGLSGSGGGFGIRALDLDLGTAVDVNDGGETRSVAAAGSSGKHVVVGGGVVIVSDGCQVDRYRLRRLEGGEFSLELGDLGLLLAIFRFQLRHVGCWWHNRGASCGACA